MALVTAVFAHRGCTDGAVENTIDAFARAGRLGADGVELDVHLTADGALAVHHDGDIDGLGPISALGASDIPPHVPLLADALAVCEGMVVNVEIKHDPAGEAGGGGTDQVAAATARVIGEEGWTDRVIVSSFDVATLHAVQQADARLALGELWPFGTDVDVALARATKAGWQAVHPFVTEVSAELVRRAHASGLAVNVWTVNGAHDLAAFVALGVDAVITDNLAEAISIARAGAG
jgi:glycerophosphoryl diester phosphodiesterase